MHRTTRRKATAFGVLLLLPALQAGLACQDYVFEQKFPEKVKEAERKINAVTPTPADILFIVDNSGSMADEQENLARNFDRFINVISAAKGDYQIAVVTTDLESQPAEKQGVAVFNYASSTPYILTNFNVQAPVCTDVAIEHGCFRGPNPATRIISSTMLPAEQISAFKDNVRVGSCGSGNEKALRAMQVALEKTAGTGCNAGFLRANANLVVIIVSDEEEADSTPIDQHLVDIRRFKPFGQIRVGAIVSSVDGVASSCRVASTGKETRTCGSLCQSKPADGTLASCDPRVASSCGAGEFCEPMSSTTGRCQNTNLRYWSNENCSWCSFYNAPDCCSAIGGSRYISFAQAIERKVNEGDSGIQITNCRGATGTRVACLVDSICQENFGDTLARIANDLILTNEYKLSPPATYPAGVHVRLKGGRYGEGVDLVNGTDFTVSADGVTVTITGSKAPVEGEEVEIYFVVAS